MNTITKHSGTNTGGIKSVKFINIKDIASIGLPDDNYAVSVSLRDANAFDEIYGTDGTIEYSEDENDSAAGNYYHLKLSLSIPKDRILVITTLRQLSGERVVAIIEYKNGDKLLAGSITEPLRKSHKRKISADLKFNGFEVVFEGTKADSPSFYYKDGDIIDSGSSSGSVS